MGPHSAVPVARALLVAVALLFSIRVSAQEADARPVSQDEAGLQDEAGPQTDVRPGSSARSEGDVSELVASARMSSLTTLGTELASEQASVRLRAFDVLRRIPGSRLEEVEARLRDLRLNDDPASAAAYNTIQEIRQHMGSQRADDAADLALGARQLLAGPRAPSRSVAQVAERLALLRALEGMDALAADRVLIGFFQRAWNVWQWEARNVVGRRGLAMLPALIEGRRAGNPEVRRWSVGSIRRLGVDSVGASVQMASPETLPDVLRAYASLSDLNAMPAIITFVDHPDPAVRAAAREATASYERNAIWQLRQAHRNKLGENADLSWSWQTTMQRLFDALDARRLAPANELLDEGLAAAASADWTVMHDRFERALRREPLLPRRSEMGPGYAAQAIARLAALEGAAASAATDAEARSALTMLRRAVRLSPDHVDASGWQASVVFHEAERARRAGVLDEGAYEEVLTLEPAHVGARAVLRDVEGGGVGQVEDRPSSMIARLMFLFGALLLLPLAAVRRQGSRALTYAGDAGARVTRWAASAVSARSLVREHGVQSEQALARAASPLALAPEASELTLPPESFDEVALTVEAGAAPATGRAEAVTAQPAEQGVANSPGRAIETVEAESDDAGSAMPGAQERTADPHVTDVRGEPLRARTATHAAATLARAAWHGAKQAANGVVRGARRLVLFVRMLSRHVWPSKPATSSVSMRRPGPLRRRVSALGSRVGVHAPRALALVGKVRSGVTDVADSGKRLASRRPPSVRELGATLAMMVRSEPPPAVLHSEAALPTQPTQHSLLRHTPAHWATERDTPAVADAHTDAVLDVDALASEDSDLDELLFGDSDPGVSSDPGVDERIPRSVLESLSRLAHDTSPGTLEAPDTLPS